MKSRAFGCVALWIITNSQVGCEHRSAPTPASATGSASSERATTSPSSSAFGNEPPSLKPRRAPVTLPSSLQGPVEPDSDPKVLADTAAVCGQLNHQRFSAFDQMATFTRRWRQLSWLYARGDNAAACQIEALVREAASYPDSECTPKRVEQFANACRVTR